MELDKIYHCDNILKHWDKFSNKEKYHLIKQLWIKDMIDGRDVSVIRILLQSIRESEMVGRRTIHGHFVNMLCITLARFYHSPNMIKSAITQAELLEEVVKTKRSLDLFYYIDSTLLFEFTLERNRKTCIKDMLNYTQSFKTDCKEEWQTILKDWVGSYAKHYDESLVTKNWYSYDSSEFERKTLDIMKNFDY